MSTVTSPHQIDEADNDYDVLDEPVENYNDPDEDEWEPIDVSEAKVTHAAAKQHAPHAVILVVHGDCFHAFGDDASKLYEASKSLQSGNAEEPDKYAMPDESNSGAEPPVPKMPAAPKPPAPASKGEFSSKDHAAPAPDEAKVPAEHLESHVHSLVNAGHQVGVVHQGQQPAAPKPAQQEEPFALNPSTNAPKQPKTDPTGGQQQTLFPKAGLPGQMNLFADKGVPDSMLPKQARQPEVKQPESPPEPVQQQPQAQESPESQRHADLLKQADPYRQPGENYSRNIHAPANRLEHSIQAGHSPSQLKMAADELEMRLKAEKPITAEPEEETPEPPAPEEPEPTAEQPPYNPLSGVLENPNELRPLTPPANMKDPAAIAAAIHQHAGEGIVPMMWPGNEEHLNRVLGQMRDKSGTDFDEAAVKHEVKKLSDTIVNHAKSVQQRVADERRGKPATPPVPEPEPTAEQSPEPEQTPEPDELDDEQHADNWNKVIEDPTKATPHELRHAMLLANHMLQYYANNPKISEEQRTAIAGRVGHHRNKIAQAIAANAATPIAKQDEPPPADEDRPAPPKTTPESSIVERHHAAGQQIDNAPAPVKDLLRSLHNLRDTRRNGYVQTKELGSEYAKEMYAHLKSNKRSGDSFGDVHDMSDELGHGAMGYSSPAGNLTIIPPKFKDDDYDVRYTLPHQSQTEQPAEQQDIPAQSEPSAADEPEQQFGDAWEGYDQTADEPESKSPWETSEQKPQAPPAKNPTHKPEEHWRALTALKQNGFNKNSILKNKIIDMVGDDPLEQHAMHQAVLQTHKDMEQERASRNHAYASLLGQFLKTAGDRTKFINLCKNVEKSGGDYSSVPRFDLMVQMVVDNPSEYGILLEHGTLNKTDVSQQLMDRFIRQEAGLEEKKPISSDDVLAEASSRLHHNAIHFDHDDPYISAQAKEEEKEHLQRMESDPEYRSQREKHREDIDSQPFSRNGNKLRYSRLRRWLAASVDRWRKYSQKMLFTWGAEEEEKHPRATGQVTVGGKTYTGGEWVPGTQAAHGAAPAKPATAPEPFGHLPLFAHPPKPQVPQPQPPQPAPIASAPPAPMAEVPSMAMQSEPVVEPPQSAEPSLPIESAQEQEPQDEPEFGHQKDAPPAEVQDVEERLTRSLSKQEEVNQFLVAKYQETKDRSIKDQIVDENTGLVKKAARRWARNPADLEEYVSYGMAGLLTAIDKFDPSKKKTFAGYASMWISNGMHAYHRFLTPGERNKIPTKTSAASQLQTDEDRPSSMDELAVQFGGDPTSPLERMELNAAVANAMKEFPDRDADAIQMRFGIGPYEKHEHTFVQIAEKIGMTPFGVQKLIERTIDKLKPILKGHRETTSYAKSGEPPQQFTVEDWQQSSTKYGLSWSRCFKSQDPERYGLLSQSDAEVIAQALADWYWNLPDRGQRDRADKYARQLGFNFGDEATAPKAPEPAKPATSPSGHWGAREESLHPRGQPENQGEFVKKNEQVTNREQNSPSGTKPLARMDAQSAEIKQSGNTVTRPDGEVRQFDSEQSAKTFADALTREKSNSPEPQDVGSGLRQSMLPILHADASCSKGDCDPPESGKGRAINMLPLEQYDKFLVQFSGGKDSTALVLHLLEEGVPKEKIELWHQKIDGGNRHFMDWPITEDYCRKVAEHLGIPLRFQWKDGGFEGELTREKQTTSGIYRETSDGKVEYLPPAPPAMKCRNKECGATFPDKPKFNQDTHQWEVQNTECQECGTERRGISSRSKFPAQGCNLQTRWCSSALKIDVASRAIANDSNLSTGKYAVLTGERAEEGGRRDQYPEAEEHRSNTKSRTVHQWRPVHKWNEKQVWDILKRHQIQPHPAYRLGYGRLSCQHCIFADKNQIASNLEIDPQGIKTIAEYEQKFGHTITQGLTIIEKAAKGTSFLKDMPGELKQLAMSEHYNEPVITDNWQYPAGAFKKSGGPGHLIDEPERHAKDRLIDWDAIHEAFQNWYGNIPQKSQPTKYSMQEHESAAIAEANATSRSGGAVGDHAIIPSIVEKIASPGDEILDFGAGKKAIQAQLLRDKGLNVTAYDYGDNLNEKHDPDALDRQYDVIYASNVLNVQDSEEELENTLLEVKESLKPGGVFIANLPHEPRKGAWTGTHSDTERLQQMLEQSFGAVQSDNSHSSPVFVCTYTKNGNQKYQKSSAASNWNKYARQLGFNFSDEPPAPKPAAAAKPAISPSTPGGSPAAAHPRAKETVTIAGKTYPGGEWIPKAQAAQATPVEKAKMELVDKASGKEEPMQAAPVAEKPEHDGDKYFDDKEMELARNQNHKSREMLIHMDPRQFLEIAEHTEGSPSKRQTVAGVLESKSKFHDVPFLGFEHDGQGSAVVRSHEGRHRAEALVKRGVTSMPVVFSSRSSKDGPAIRWGSQDENNRDRLNGDWPKWLHGETSGTIRFPVPDKRQTTPNVGATRQPEEKTHESRILDDQEARALEGFEEQSPSTEKPEEKAPRELSVTEETRREFVENFNRVSADPRKAKSRDLHRASSYLQGLMNHHERQFQREEIDRSQLDDLMTGLKREQDWYTTLLKGRGDYAGGGPYSDEDMDKFNRVNYPERFPNKEQSSSTEQLAHDIAKESAETGQNIWTLAKNRGITDVKTKKEVIDKIINGSLRDKYTPPKPEPSDARKKAMERSQQVNNPQSFSHPKFEQDLEAAIGKIESGQGQTSLPGMLSMHDLRRHLPHYSPQEFTAGIRKLREDDKFSAESPHGKLPPEVRAAGIQEGPDNLVWLKRR